MYTLQPLPVHKTYYLFNMHQTMIAKDYQDRGKINRINRRQHPPHRKFRVYQVRKRVNMGEWDVQRFLVRKYISAYSFSGLKGKEGLEQTNDLYCIIDYMSFSMLIITVTSVKIIFNHDHEKMNEQCIVYVFNRYSWWYCSS